MPRNQRERIMRGRIDPVTDIVALRRFAGLTQGEFAEALGFSVHTLQNWEQQSHSPEGQALALLRLATRHPRVLRGESLRFGLIGVYRSKLVSLGQAANFGFGHRPRRRHCYGPAVYQTPGHRDVALNIVC